MSRMWCQSGPQWIWRVSWKKNLDGLELEVPRHRRGVEVLCETCNMSRRLIDFGHLVLFNVEFLSHGLPWLINIFTNTFLQTFPRRHIHTHIHPEWKSAKFTLHVLVYQLRKSCREGKFITSCILVSFWDTARLAFDVTWWWVVDVCVYAPQREQLRGVTVGPLSLTWCVYCCRARANAPPPPTYPVLSPKTETFCFVAALW